MRPEKKNTRQRKNITLSPLDKLKDDLAKDITINFRVTNLALKLRTIFQVPFEQAIQTWDFASLKDIFNKNIKTPEDATKIISILLDYNPQDEETGQDFQKLTALKIEIFQNELSAKLNQETDPQKKLQLLQKQLEQINQQNNQIKRAKDNGIKSFHNLIEHILNQYKIAACSPPPKITINSQTQYGYLNFFMRALMQFDAQLVKLFLEKSTWAWIDNHDSDVTQHCLLKTILTWLVSSKMLVTTNTEKATKILRYSLEQLKQRYPKADEFHTMLEHPVKLPTQNPEFQASSLLLHLSERSIAYYFPLIEVVGSYSSDKSLYHAIRHLLQQAVETPKNDQAVAAKIDTLANFIQDKGIHWEAQLQPIDYSQLPANTQQILKRHNIFNEKTIDAFIYCCTCTPPSFTTLNTLQDPTKTPAHLLPLNDFNRPVSSKLMFVEASRRPGRPF